jgi:hypothetical protein
VRKCDSWLKSWLDYSSAWEAPERFRLWSGIATISAVMQRKLFTFVKGQRLYANTYILLIGSPGSGKGNAMKYLAEWLKELDGEYFKIAPDGVTKRAFYIVLEAGKQFPGGDLSHEQHSLTAFVEELGVFLQPGDNDFIYSLCRVFDCPSKFHYKTAHAGENQALNASFSMLSACTPKALRDIFTEDAMELGISARTMIIFADDKVDIAIFGKRENSERMEKDLKYDLSRMLEVIGEYQFDNDAAQELMKWSQGDFGPQPKDPRFEHYNSRRFIQIIKLCMIFALSKRDDPVILLEDLNDVRSIILEAERYMPRAIETLGANPLLLQQQLAIKHINLIWKNFNRATEESEIYTALARDVAPNLVKDLIDYVANAKWVGVIGTAPNRQFLPRGKGGKEDE